MAAGEDSHPSTCRYLAQEGDQARGPFAGWVMQAAQEMASDCQEDCVYRMSEILVSTVMRVALISPTMCASRLPDVSY